MPDKFPAAASDNLWRGKQVLITGGLGFIGSNLARRLVALGAHVTLVDSLIPEYGGNPFNVADIRNELESRHTLKQYEVFLNATTAAAKESLATAPPSIVAEGQARALQVSELEVLWQEVEATK